jgi:hypothetical protein
MTVQELEAKIYDTFYDNNPDGDARTNGLWKDVIDAKKEVDPLAELQSILRCVENDIYY